MLILFFMFFVLLKKNKKNKIRFFEKVNSKSKKNKNFIFIYPI